jgi:hypothetical protein
VAAIVPAGGEGKHGGGKGGKMLRFVGFGRIGAIFGEMR